LTNRFSILKSRIPLTVQPDGHSGINSRRWLLGIGFRGAFTGFTFFAYIYMNLKFFPVAQKSKAKVAKAEESVPEAIKSADTNVPVKRKLPSRVSVVKIFHEKEIPMAQIDKTNVDHHMAKKYLTKYLDRVPTEADIDKATIIKKSDSISYLKYGGKFLGTMTKTIYQTPEQKKAGKGIGVKMEFKPK
jgi:hypothetical protein